MREKKIPEGEEDGTWWSSLVNLFLQRKWKKDEESRPIQKQWKETKRSWGGRNILKGWTKKWFPSFLRRNVGTTEAFSRSVTLVWLAIFTDFFEKRKFGDEMREKTSLGPFWSVAMHTKAGKICGWKIRFIAQSSSAHRSLILFSFGSLPTFLFENLYHIVFLSEVSLSLFRPRALLPGLNSRHGHPLGSFYIFIFMLTFFPSNIFNAFNPFSVKSK